MVKQGNKFISVILALMMVVTMCALPSVSAASTTDEQVSAKTLPSKYATNPNNQTGVNKTITIDGNFSDWSESMLIAQGAAWDVANNWKGSHENCVLDTYSLYAAWDNDNLYVAWQMVNTTDTWARSGDGPLSDGGRVLDVPLILALSVDPSSTSMSNKNTDGGSIWGQKMGVKFDTHVDRLFYMSGKPGLGEPAMFKAVDAQGNTNYTTGCTGFAKGGIEYKMATGCLPSSIIGLNNSKSPDDVFSESSEWVDYKTFQGSMGKHDTQYDSFYEMKIPLKTLGIDVNYLKTKGIGAMLVATRGESGLDCIPYDPSMIDNALGDYSFGDNTSKEKEDEDVITVPFARIGNGSVTPPQPTVPTVPTEPTNPPIGDATYKGSKTVTVKAGQTVDFTVKANAAGKVGGFDVDTKFDASQFAIDTTFGDKGYKVASGRNVINNESGSSSLIYLAGEGAAIDASSSAELYTLRLKALSSGTYTINYTINQLISDNLTNILMSSTPVSGVAGISETVVGGEIPTVPTDPTVPTPPTDPSGVTGSAKVSVKAGDKVTYKVSLKYAKKLYGVNLNVLYDKDVLTLDTTQGQDGVTMPNFNGTKVINGTALASQGKVAIIGANPALEDFTTEKDLATMTFIAKKDASTTISYLFKEVKGEDGVNAYNPTTGQPVNSDASSNNTATVVEEPTPPTEPTFPITGQTTIKVKKGDVVRYFASIDTPDDVAAIDIRMYYDSDMLELDKKFGDNGIANNNGIPYAIGESSTPVPYITGVGNTELTDEVRANCFDMNGFGYTKPKDAMAAQFIAKADGTVQLYYYIRQLVSKTDNNVSYVNRATGEMINGAKSDNRALIIHGDEPVYRLGDVNNDGRINLLDVALVRAYLAGEKTLTETQLKAANVYKKDTTDVDLADVVEIARHVTGSISGFTNI